MSNTDEILKLKELLDENIITKEEFEKKKNELLYKDINTDIDINDNIQDRTNFNNDENDEIINSGRNSIFRVIEYIFGILFIMSGFGSMIINKIVAGICAISIGLIILPKFNDLLNKKVNIKLSKKIKIVICIVLFYIYTRSTISNLC